MRLLNTATPRLEEFIGDDIPEYVILSHRWGTEEVTLQDVETGKAPEKHAGWSKLMLCCRQAARDGFSWIWVDTCCIDKTSSTELSESINSMYEWYQKSSICYAFLIDCHGKKDFAKSQWWTRGWTLQELIAPAVVEFYDADWTELGSKLSLHEAITSITGIDMAILTGVNHLFERNVAVRMSWAANRRTTRVEDQAYCLMGLFGVNMPLLYGEGERAFTRLQEEIIKVREDYTLFVWAPRPDDRKGIDRRTRGLLAEQPSDFLSCNDAQAYHHNPWHDRLLKNSTWQPWELTALSRNCFSLFPTPKEHEAPFMTSRGLRVTMPMYQPDSRKMMAFACVTLLNEGLTTEQLVCVVLLRLGPQSTQYVRSTYNDLIFLSRSDKDYFSYQSVNVLKPRSNIGRWRGLSPADTSMTLLIVAVDGHYSKQLNCYFPRRATMADLLCLEDKFRSGEESVLSDDQQLKLTKFLVSLGAREGKQTLSLRQDLIAQCLGNAPELCWLVDNDGERSKGRKGLRDTLCFGFDRYDFEVHVELYGDRALCDAASTTMGAPPDRPRGTWPSSLYDEEEDVLLTDRTRVSLLAPQSPRVDSEAQAIELAVGIRRVATSPWGIKRYVLSIADAALGAT